MYPSQLCKIAHSRENSCNNHWMPWKLAWGLINIISSACAQAFPRASHNIWKIWVIMSKKIFTDIHLNTEVN